MVMDPVLNVLVFGAQGIMLFLGAVGIGMSLADYHKEIHRGKLNVRTLMLLVLSVMTTLSSFISLIVPKAVDVRPSPEEFLAIAFILSIITSVALTILMHHAYHIKWSRLFGG